jgi:ATP synthase F1 gamma subunit
MVMPKETGSTAFNFLYMLNGEEPGTQAEKTLDLCLILHAEHGMNASTFTCRTVAGTLSDLYSAVTGAIGALKGPLHGGANTAVMKMLMELEDQGKDAKILVVGDKGRAQLRRLFGEHFTGVMSELSTPITWDLAACIAQVAIDQKASHVHVLYNNFKSAISYVPMVRSLSALSAEPTEGEEEAVLGNYEFEPNNKEEVFANMQEYMLASQIYYSLLENATSEQSSRMNAMENASKNAGEMIDSLTLQYNRARQARITTELVEIISGASAL